MADTKISALSTDASALGGTEIIPGVQSAANVKITPAQIKTYTSASPTLVTPVLGVATATSVAIGGATIGANALAITGNADFSGYLEIGGAYKTTLSGGYFWGASNTSKLILGASADVALARSAAATFQITNNDTATGTLIFKFPTADPGIPGVWWDNAGTLTKSV